MAIHSQVVYGCFLVTIAAPSRYDRDLIAQRRKIVTVWPICGEGWMMPRLEDTRCCGLHEGSGRKQRLVEHLLGPGTVQSTHVCISFHFPWESFLCYSLFSLPSFPISVWRGGEEGQRDGGWAQS